MPCPTSDSRTLLIGAGILFNEKCPLSAYPLLLLWSKTNISQEAVCEAVSTLFVEKNPSLRGFQMQILFFFPVEKVMSGSQDLAGETPKRVTELAVRLGSCRVEGQEGRTVSYKT